MNSGATADRVYDGLKRQLLSGDVAPAGKLEPGPIAADLSSSVTPVRDALHRLIGEQLVETRSGEGFYAPHVSEPALRDLYGWNLDLLAFVLRAQHRPFPPPPPRHDGGRNTLAGETAAIFARLARGSDNEEHWRAIESASDRLQVARIAEGRVFDDLGAELDGLKAMLEADDKAALRRLLTRYHRRRQRATAMIVRAIYRDRAA